ncbi:MAG: glutamine-hydrolyzing carbamoyl-phosphate synthase small subunit [Verrucomicrobiota bacterium]
MNWNWLEQRTNSAFLALEDGAIFRGHSVGVRSDAVGEVVFNTGMTGYQEILSDPSYAGQFVVMTYPEMGNTGTNSEDMESAALFANGLIMHKLNNPSNWRAENSLAQCLVRNNKPALAGLDTRRLTLKLREHGSMKGYMAVAGKVSEHEAVAKAAQWEGLDGQDYARRVTCNAPYSWDQDGAKSRSWGIAHELPPTDMKIVAYDFGIKWNILRNMRLNGFDVTVVPAGTTPMEVLALKPDGVVLSNGPADPAAVGYAIQSARELLGKVPLMGICLGHQILALAAGAATYRLKFGHHGCNHPVQDLKTGKVAITSQNHNFAVDAATIDSSKIEITHLNLNDKTVEGMAHRFAPMFSAQYHPEAGPGPHDSRPMFQKFRDLIRNAGKPLLIGRRSMT